MDIELLNISPEESWPSAKQKDYEQLKVITRRVVDRNIDITNGFTEDLNSVVSVYARYATEEAKKLLTQVCQLSASYNADKLESAWIYWTKENKLQSNRRLTNICKKLDVDTTVNSEALNEPEELAAYLPADVDPKFVLEHGFYPLKSGLKSGYYFRTGDKTFASQSNFILEPLMHVLSKTDNKRIIAIDNGFKRSILDLPSRALISVEQFSGFCFEEGNYIFWGGKLHLMKIVNSLNDRFPVCYELKTLGWQPEGFFAWANAVFVAGCSLNGDGSSNIEQRSSTNVLPFNDLGIATVAETNYFSPSASDIYKNQRAEDDEYENDRYLKYQESPVNFQQWCQMFHNVYPQQSMYGIGFVFIGLFKDVIYKIDNNCPHLSAYGEKGSGKSKFAESVSAVFLNDLQPFNLNHGTDFAFFNRLSRFRNCVTWFDEFDDQAIKEDRFQSIKGAYDGAGRERGKGGSKSKTEIARINSALLLTGQYLSTRDDNAALTRCIILAFTPDNDRSEDSIKNYEALKTIEKKGITSILTELLQHREAFAKEYQKEFHITFSELRELIREMNGEYKERVLRNYSAILHCFKFFTRHFQFPFTYDQVKQKAAKDVIRLSTMISESDSLADFWNTIVYLKETGEVHEGFHYRILQLPTISIRKEDGKDKPHNFSKPTKLLCLRLTTVHKLYLEAFRRQNGKTGINMQSLELYISSAKGFIGKNSSLQFTNPENGKITATSSHVFDLELLGVPLEDSAPEAEEKHQSTVEGVLHGTIKHEIVAGKPKLKYTIMNQSTTMVAGQPFTSFEYTTCYDQNLSNEPLILSEQRLVLTGQLKLSSWKDNDGNKKEKRTLDVDSVSVKDNQLNMNKGLSEDEELPFP
jgi:hypothetical protein